MSDIKLFRYGGGKADELKGASALVEKQIQNLIESQMEVFLGIRFLASEHDTGKTHKGRIDSLGLDENGCPVIIEYKRHMKTLSIRVCFISIGCWITKPNSNYW